MPSLKQNTYKMLGAFFAALLLLASDAGAQPSGTTPNVVVTQVNLGVRQAGQTYPLTLNAQNVNCNDPMDFRFTSNAAWLQLPADPVVRGVIAGQARDVAATIDLRNMSPGQYRAIVEVECENCGWFVFKSCRIDKQQITFLIDVGAAPAGRPNAGQQKPQLDPNDPRIPEAQRTKLKAAIVALDKANAKKKPCEEERDKLGAAAQAAREKADKAAKDAKEAADKATQAEEEAKKAQAKADAADKEEKAAKAHAAKTEAAQGPNAKDTKDAKAAADAAAADAAKAGVDNQKAQQAARDARAAAQKAADAAAKAEAHAKAAADAAAQAESKCARAQAEADQAQAEKDAAEERARAAIPQPPPAARQLTPEELRAQAQEEFDRCNNARIELLVRQAKALKFLIEVGAIKGEEAESLLKDLKKALDDAKKYTQWLPGPVARVVNAALDAASAGLGIATGLKGLNAKVNFTPNAADSTKDNIKKKLKDDGQAKDDKEAEEIYKEMKSLTEEGTAKGSERWKREREEADKSCNATKEKLDAATKASGK